MAMPKQRRNKSALTVTTCADLTVSLDSLVGDRFPSVADLSVHLNGLDDDLLPVRAASFDSCRTFGSMGFAGEPAVHTREVESRSTNEFDRSAWRHSFRFVTADNGSMEFPVPPLPSPTALHRSPMTAAADELRAKRSSSSTYTDAVASFYSANTTPTTPTLVTPRTPYMHLSPPSPTQPKSKRLSGSPQRVPPLRYARRPSEPLPEVYNDFGSPSSSSHPFLPSSPPPPQHQPLPPPPPASEPLLPTPPTLRTLAHRLSIDSTLTASSQMTEARGDDRQRRKLNLLKRSESVSGSDAASVKSATPKVKGVLARCDQPHAEHRLEADKGQFMEGCAVCDRMAVAWVRYHTTKGKARPSKKRAPVSGDETTSTSRSSLDSTMSRATTATHRTNRTALGVSLSYPSSPMPPMPSMLVTAGAPGTPQPHSAHVSEANEGLYTPGCIACERLAGSRGDLSPGSRSTPDLALKKKLFRWKRK